MPMRMVFLSSIRECPVGRMVSLVRRKLDRQVHDLAETLAERDDVTLGEPVRRDPAVPLPQRDAQFEAGEMRADAAVDARAEGEVLVGGTCEVDGVGGVVHL